MSSAEYFTHCAKHYTKVLLCFLSTQHKKIGPLYVNIKGPDQAAHSCRPIGTFSNCQCILNILLILLTGIITLINCLIVLANVVKRSYGINRTHPFVQNWLLYPANTQCRNNVVTKSLQRQDVEATLFGRRCLLGNSPANTQRRNNVASTSPRRWSELLRRCARRRSYDVVCWLGVGKAGLDNRRKFTWLGMLVQIWHRNLFLVLRRTCCEDTFESPCRIMIHNIRGEFNKFVELGV